MFSTFQRFVLKQRACVRQMQDFGRCVGHSNVNNTLACLLYDAYNWSVQASISLHSHGDSGIGIFTLR